MDITQRIKVRKNQFIRYCLDYDEKIQQKLPFISNGQKLEAILIEFRLLPHLSFIIKNAILKLGKSWSFTIVCGKINFSMFQQIIKNINRNIRLICHPVNNLTREQYSILLLRSSFYNQFEGTHLLFMQEDSLIFKSLPEKFLMYDYLGAPFSDKTVGNGGLSLRHKNTMIHICQKYFDHHHEMRELYADYIKKHKSKLIARYGERYFDHDHLYFFYQIELGLIEDYQITKIMRERKIGKLAPFTIGLEFSIEKFYYDDSFGAHQFWYCVDNVYDWLVKKMGY